MIVLSCRLIVKYFTNSIVKAASLFVKHFTIRSAAFLCNPCREERTRRSNRSIAAPHKTRLRRTCPRSIRSSKVIVSEFCPPNRRLPAFTSENPIGNAGIGAFSTSSAPALFEEFEEIRVSVLELMLVH
jgi:hypothetical protein